MDMEELHLEFHLTIGRLVSFRQACMNHSG
jgi:hypothetical protein